MADNDCKQHTWGVNEMVNAHDVAAHILRTKSSLSGVSLQKLLYYAHAWHLVAFDSPLFSERIEAWKLGPVVYDVWDSHRNQRVVSVQDVLSRCSTEVLNESEAAVVDAVVELFSDLDQWKLADLVHEERPWIDAYHRDDKWGHRISDEAIKEFYASVAATSPENRGVSRVPRLPEARISYVSKGEYDELFGDLDTPDDVSGFLAALQASRNHG
ncbi:DUF4065 domain-containing protein [Rhodococcus hoagii]|nr:DUF4065 domain-containing protein [Prescottella equi]